MQGTNAVAKDSKLSVLEQRLGKLTSAVRELEALTSELQGGPTPEELKKLSEITPIRCLLAILNEAPDQLTNLSDRISKSIEEIRQILY